MKHSSIMVVEDEIVVAMEIEEKLRAIGYDVAAICSSGEDAVSEMANRRPDLVLMDIRLDGDLDGIQTAELIRRQHDVPVIYLTAYADDTTLNRAKLTEPFGYLVKPFSQTELRTTIEVALYKHVQDQKTKEVARWFSSTINILGAALIVTDKDGIISHLNHVAECLTGWSQHNAAGMNLTNVYMIKDRVTGKIMENPVSMPLKVGYSSGGHFGLLISKNRTEVEIEGTIMPITDSEGGFSGVIIAFQEVTPDDMENQGWFNHAANLYLTATLACSDGELAKAESFYRRSLLLFEKHLGSDHVKVANIVNDLIQLYKTMGKNNEAAKLEKRASGKGVGANVNMWM